MRSNLLVIMSKYPIAGNVKTRLGKSIGMVHAADLQRALLLDLVENHCGQLYDIAIDIPASNAKYLLDFKQLLPHVPIRVSSGEDLRGEKSHMWDMFTHYLKHYQKVIAIYSDTPKVGASLVEKAFWSLESYDVVLGPDLGVGYYLIGMSKSYDLFSSLKKGRGSYFKETLDLIRELGLSFTLMEGRVDVDTVEDLAKVQWDEQTGDWLRTTCLLRELGLWMSDDI